MSSRRSSFSKKPKPMKKTATVTTTHTTPILKPLPNSDAVKIMEDVLKLTIFLNEQKCVIASASEAINKANDIIAGIQKEFAVMEPKMAQVMEGMKPAAK
jgi:hypothetical protein